MTMSDDEIRKRYAAMHSADLNLFPDACWGERHLYAQHRSRDELNRLLHYGHIIPISRGFTERFVDENYPGWTWNQLVRVLTAAGIFVNRGGAPPCCHPDASAVHFDSETGWLVEWEGGRITVGSALPGASTPRPAGRGLAAFDLGTGEQLEE